MNNPDSGGVGPVPMNNPNGIRMSTGLTYINPNRHRLNLTVRGNVLVRRIMFDGNRAAGVEVGERRGRFFRSSQSKSSSAREPSLPRKS